MSNISISITKHLTQPSPFGEERQSQILASARYFRDSISYLIGSFFFLDQRSLNLFSCRGVYTKRIRKHRTACAFGFALSNQPSAFSLYSTIMILACHADAGNICGLCYRKRKAIIHYSCDYNSNYSSKVPHSASPTFSNRRRRMDGSLIPG